MGERFGAEHPFWTCHPREIRGLDNPKKPKNRPSGGDLLVLDVELGERVGAEHPFWTCHPRKVRGLRAALDVENGNDVSLRCIPALRRFL